MKYIDAEKLIAEIERLHKAHSGKYGCDEVAINLEHLEDFIASLQQEQPDGYNRAMLEVKAKVDKLYDETSIGLNEYDAGLYNGITETCMKLRGFINARISSQEQPEVDLEKEIKEQVKKYYDYCSKKLSEMSDDDTDVSFLTLDGFARHFYELGLNARKEK